MSPWLRASAKGSARSQMGIQEVRDDVLGLNDGSYRIVLETSSVNFELHSEDEQDALIETYQSFLNSLTEPLQILVRVRELDIDRYLESYQSRSESEPNDIYRTQLRNYGEFMRSLVAGNKILSRRFYIVLPSSGASSEDFDYIREQLLFEQEIVTKGLQKLGISARRLTTLEILDLFYSFYLPSQAKTQPLTAELLRQSHAYSII